MKKIFLSMFYKLLELGSNSKNAIINAWKIASLQGNETVVFILASNGEVVQRETTGVYTPYISKTGNIVVRFETKEGQIKSFKLDNLIA